MTIIAKMIYLGNVFKYKINRSPSENEKKNRLLQNSMATATQTISIYDTPTVIEFNSKYMDIIDKYFSNKGRPSFLSITSIIIHASTIFFILTIPLDEIAAYLTVAAVITMNILCMAYWIFVLRKESFSYTHYPIRMDRQNGMVHVFRQDGSTLSQPWQSIFFCISSGPEMEQEIQCHVFYENCTVIRETFCLPIQILKSQNKKILIEYWEFIRRYMEDGPDSIIEHVNFCIPIANQREDFNAYWKYSNGTSGNVSIIFFLLSLLAFLPVYPFRWFAMKTSKIPVWPEHIQQQCVVDPDDPYIRNASTNQI